MATRKIIVDEDGNQYMYVGPGGEEEEEEDIEMVEFEEEEDSELEEEEEDEDEGEGEGEEEEDEQEKEEEKNIDYKVAVYKNNQLKKVSKPKEAVQYLKKKKQVAAVPLPSAAKVKKAIKPQSKGVNKKVNIKKTKKAIIAKPKKPAAAAAALPRSRKTSLNSGKSLQQIRRGKQQAGLKALKDKKRPKSLQIKQVQKLSKKEVEKRKAANLKRAETRRRKKMEKEAALAAVVAGQQIPSSSSSSAHPTTTTTSAAGPVSIPISQNSTAFSTLPTGPQIFENRP